MSPRIGAILLSFALASVPLWAAKANRKLGAVVNPNIIDLVAGTPATVNVAAATTDPILVGDQFRIDVPEGSAQLRVALTASDPTLDLDLHVRYARMRAAQLCQGVRVRQVRRVTVGVKAP